VLDGARRVGVTAGASAPEVLVEEILDALSERYLIDVEIVRAVDEDVVFPLPRPLRGEAAE
jgi:4-hydroxy-3-methylbut-2-enyl diphosphate reductase